MLRVTLQRGVTFQGPELAACCDASLWHRCGCFRCGKAGSVTRQKVTAQPRIEDRSAESAWRQRDARCISRGSWSDKACAVRPHRNAVMMGRMTVAAHLMRALQRLLHTARTATIIAQWRESVDALLCSMGLTGWRPQAASARIEKQQTIPAAQPA
jgi:hypothetical protein